MPDRHLNGRAPDPASLVDDCTRASSGDGAPASHAEAGESASPVGKRSRGRFAAAPVAPRAAAGSIAISFAVVAFRNWPRRGI